MSAPRIGPMRRRHIPDVVAIEQQSHDRPWSAGLFEAELDQDDRHYVTAWSQDTLLGYGGVMLVLHDAHITNVAVDPAHRGQGIAGDIVLALLEAALRSGATAATLEVRAGNTAAQRLYSSFGFAPVGVRPGYYPPRPPDTDRHDAIIMWATDIDGPAYGRRLDARRQGVGDPQRVGAAPAEAVS